MHNGYFVFSDYIHHAMLNANYQHLEDGSFSGVIPACNGVVGLGKTKKECRLNLRSALESWLLLRMNLGHSLPVVHGINLNGGPIYEENYSM